MEYQAKRILVTGGAGFIASNFIQLLATQSNIQTIVNLDALTYAGNLENLVGVDDDPRYHFHHGDITDRDLVSTLLDKYNIDTIVHFAAESHVDRSITGPAAFITSNIVGTFTLLDCAKTKWLDQDKRESTQCRFHHISTDEVYGSLQASDPAFTETTAYAPNSPYSASKASSDHLVRAYFHTYGLPITLSNCSNNYGPHQHPEKLIPKIIECCQNKTAIPIYGDGSNIRDWLYVTDHCEAILSILKSGGLGETYNIGGNTEKTNLEIAHTICDHFTKISDDQFNYRELITFVTDRLGHDWRYAIDGTKIRSELAWTPKENFSSGIEKTIAMLAVTAET